ncbi:MAG: DUF4920 domain-containing protein [Bacteroidetes bacterium]|nr:MAG: DUF4920 domain-containing protein [Bacteroidota bacterium]
MKFKFYITFSAVALILFSLSSCTCDGECSQKDLSQTTSKSTSEHEAYYGSVIETTGALDAKSVRERLQNSDSVKVRMKGTVVTTCAKKGCWMDVASGEDTVFVKFQDYKFFVPTAGVEGFHTVMEGVAFYDTTSVDDLRHFAEDAGKSEEEIASITEPEYRLQFTATGVMMDGLE